MRAFRIITFFAITAVLFAFAGCGGSKTNPAPVTDVELGKLSQAWKVGTVSKDGVDKTSVYTANNFLLTLSGTKGTLLFDYATTGRPSSPFLSPWPASGKWSFKQDSNGNIIGITRDPGGASAVDLTYAVTPTTLQLTFQFTGTGYTNPRKDVVTGQWVFNFTK